MKPTGGDVLSEKEEHNRAVKKRLLELEHDGRITPDDVIEDAKNPESPLHEEFDWNLERAAHRTWVERARELIRTVQYEVRTETTEYRVPRYLRDPDAASDQQAYISVPRILTDSDVAKRALRAEVARALTLFQRCRGYASALGLEPELEELLVRAEALRARVETERTAA